MATNEPKRDDSTPEVPALSVAHDLKHLGQREALERELRRYVKRDGGFRKGLDSADQDRCRAVMAALGRKQPKWDLGINIYTDKELATFQQPKGRDRKKRKVAML